MRTLFQWVKVTPENEPKDATIGLHLVRCCGHTVSLGTRSSIRPDVWVLHDATLVKSFNVEILQEVKSDMSLGLEQLIIDQINESYNQYTGTNEAIQDAAYFITAKIKSVFKAPADEEIYAEAEKKYPYVHEILARHNLESIADDIPEKKIFNMQQDIKRQLYFTITKETYQNLLAKFNFE